MRSVKGNDFDVDYKFGRIPVDYLLEKFPKRYRDITDQQEQKECGDLYDYELGINIEVKHDSTKYRNFFLEEKTSEKNSGWANNLLWCDVLLYKFSRDGFFWHVQFSEVRRIVRDCQQNNTWPLRKCSRSSAFGWCVPITVVRGAVKWFA